MTGDERPDIPAEGSDPIVGTYQPFVSASGELIFQAFVISAPVDPETGIANAEIVVPQVARSNMRSDPASCMPIFYCNASGRVNNTITRSIHMMAAAAFRQRYPGLNSVVIADNLASHRQPDLLKDLKEQHGQIYLFTPPNLTHLYGICDSVLFANLSTVFANERSKISMQRTLLGVPMKGSKHGSFLQILEDDNHSKNHHGFI